MVYRLNETTWLQDAGGGAEILNILNWAMLTIAEYCAHEYPVPSYLLVISMSWFATDG